MPAAKPLDSNIVQPNSRSTPWRPHLGATDDRTPRHLENCRVLISAERAIGRLREQRQAAEQRLHAFDDAFFETIKRRSVRTDRCGSFPQRCRARPRGAIFRPGDLGCGRRSAHWTPCGLRQGAASRLSPSRHRWFRAPRSSARSDAPPFRPPRCCRHQGHPIRGIGPDRGAFSNDVPERNRVSSPPISEARPRCVS